MKKTSSSEILGTIVFLSGLSVMAGWAWDIPALKSVLPHGITMKFSTALSFSLSGIILFLLARFMKGESIAQILLLVPSLIVLFLMGTLLLSSFSDVRTGLEDLFMQEAEEAALTVTPGRPSVATMVCFILISAAGLAAMIEIPALKKILAAAGGIAAGSGCLALLGYLLQAPVLYYAVEGWSTGMAIHTAFLFVLSGAGLVLLEKRVEAEKRKYVSIRLKLTFVFLSLFIIPFLFVEELIIVNGKDFFKRTLFSKLHLIAESKEAEILEYMAGKKGRAADFASDGFIRDELDRMAGPLDPEERERAIRGLSEYLREYKLPIDPEIVEIRIVDPEGRPLALAGEGALPGPRSHEHQDEHEIIEIASPLTGRTDGKLLGTLILEYNIGILADILSGARAGNLGARAALAHAFIPFNAYLAGQDGKVIASSLQKPDTLFLQDKTGKKPIRECLENSRESAGTWTGLQGKAVWGASMCMEAEKGRKWVLLIEMKESDALAPIRKLRNLAVFVGLATLFILSLVSIAIAKSISRPIQVLGEGAEAIGSGNLDHRIRIDSNDETGALALAFNQMARNLRQITASRDDLNREVEERKRAEERLEESENRFRALFEESPNGLLVIDPETALPLAFNDVAFLQLGYTREEFAKLRTPDYEAVETSEETKKHIEHILEHGRDFFETKHRARNGAIKDILVTAKTITFFGHLAIYAVFQDITYLKQTEEKLKRAMLDLKRSNEDLERFAYVASHDLQEPLRMVVSYLQLLERRYRGKLDSDADEFINFAVDGAKRMQGLINGLLSLSRIAGRGKPFALASSESALREALGNLQRPMEESKAEVVQGHLPEILADPSQLVQLFQNLIYNAIKFRGENPPKIHVKAERIESSEIRLPQSEINKGWLFSVRDNGIGIDPQSADRIFNVFQRLHGREYPGMGIGLSLCKKIVERHGGRIWVESEPGKGATFYFTMPDREA